MVTVLVAFLFVPAAFGSMADVNSRLDQASASLAKARDAKENLRYERSLNLLNDAVGHTKRAANAAGKLSGRKREKADRKVAAQQERNAFLAAQLANSAAATGPPDITQTSIVKTLELTLDLVDDVLVGGTPGSLLGPGGTINWTGLLNQLP